MPLSVSEREFQFQWQVNHGTEWNAEFSFPRMTLTDILLNCWVLKKSYFTKKNSHPSWPLEEWINNLISKIAHILCIPQPAKRVNFFVSPGKRKKMTETIPFSFPPVTRTVVAMISDVVVSTPVLVVAVRLAVDDGRVEIEVGTIKTNDISFNSQLTQNNC